MNLEADVERVRLAQKSVRAELFAERNGSDHWVGHMSSSPVATATAVSALVVAHQHDAKETLSERDVEHEEVGELLIQGELSELLVNSMYWLARCQNADGGWGDCVGAHSNLAATMLVQAAFRLTGVPGKYADLIARADHYVHEGGDAASLRRFGPERLLTAPVLANCALAGMVPWRSVPTLPFELACLPQRWQKLLRFAVAPHWLPTLIAVGFTKFLHDRPGNPFTRVLRGGLKTKALALVDRMQAADGSFLASTPVTAYVVMSLASAGLHDSPIVERGVEYLFASVRPDASWSVYENLSVRNTALAVSNLCVGSSEATDTAWHDTAGADDSDTHVDPALDASAAHLSTNHDKNEPTRVGNACIDWLLNTQHTKTTPGECAPPGGWGPNDAPGTLVNVFDTSAVLLAFARFPRAGAGPARREKLDRTVRSAVGWLLDEQDADGGWSTFCDSTGFVAIDQSGVDVTANALRALAVWRRRWVNEPPSIVPPKQQASLNNRLDAAIKRGFAYLETQQDADGSFIPLWFGNEEQPGGTNPVCGTALVLMAYAEANELNTETCEKAGRWLVAAQHTCGGWGPPRAPLDYSGNYRVGSRTWRENDVVARSSSAEETALAVMALEALAANNGTYDQAVAKGRKWLVDAIEQDRHHKPAIIGWCFPRLWYYERLYPLIFAGGALATIAVQPAPEWPTAASIS